LSPTIDASLQKYAGSTDPIMRARAKKLIIDALPRYDSQKASLKTFVDRQIQPVIRWQAQRKQVLKSPDRALLDAITIGKAERALEQENGRIPSTQEIADRVGLSLNRVQDIRRRDKLVQVASHEVSQEGDVATTADEGAVIDDARESAAWQKFIYHDLTDIDKVIFEHTTGFGGARKMSNSDIAKRLRITPGAVSQRKRRIQMLLDRQEELSPFQ
jgi:DNA-directed RNA polymerase specialized sigma subunit